MSSRKKIVILGAGLVGLSLAWHLEKFSENRCDLTVIDQAQEVGGKVQSEQISNALYERGPHTLRLAPPYLDFIERLLQELDLKDEVIYPSSSMKTRYVAYDKKLHPVPPHPSKLLNPSLALKVLLPLLCEPFKRKKFNSIRASEDCSIEEFISERFGPYIRDYFVEPMVSGIYGGDIRDLSLKSCFPILDQLKDRKGSLVLNLLKLKKKNSSRIISLKGGLSSIPKRLAMKSSANFILGEKVLGLELGGKPRVLLKNSSIECDHIFSALPAHSLSPLLQDKEMASIDFLKNFPFLSYKILHFGFNQKQDFPEAFGFLTLPSRKEKFSGVIFNSSLFPSQDSKKHQSRLTVMVSQKSPFFNFSDTKLTQEVCTELKCYLKLSSSPSYQKVHTIRNAIPQYHVGHQSKLKTFELELKEKFPRLTLTGSSFYGSSIPQCLDQGLRFAKEYCENFRQAATQS